MGNGAEYCATAEDLAEFVLARTAAVQTSLKRENTLGALAHQGALLEAEELLRRCEGCDELGRFKEDEEPSFCTAADDLRLLSRKLLEETAWIREARTR